MDIAKKYKDLLKETDSIFETPRILKELYLNGLKAIDQSKLQYAEKKNINNAIGALSNISKDSINEAERAKLSKLYAQAIVLAVSQAEVLLAISFEVMLETYLEHGRVIEKIDDIKIPFKLIREHKLTLTKEDSLEIIRERFDDDKNPREKLNFQNIKSVIGHFDGYLGMKLELSDELTKKLHLYYQLRHLQIHALGVVDKRFIKNLQAAGIECKFNLKDRVIFNEEMYRDCKESFTNFFDILGITMSQAILKIAIDKIDGKGRASSETKEEKSN